MENQQVNSSLEAAVREGNLEEVRKLINSLGLSHSQEWSQGYVLLCDALKNMAGCSHWLRSHEEEALKNRLIEVAKLLLTSGSTVNIKSEEPADTPLHFAVMSDSIEIVKMILDKGADVDAKNEYGQTPLHVAAYKGYLQIVEHLLDNGANVNCVSTGKKNYTPLHFAVEIGAARYKVIALLLSRGADVDAKNECGMTPLHVAAEKEELQIAEHLLDNGAYVNCVCTGRKNYTPLHFAVEKGSTEVIRSLLSRGADANAKGEDGITPLHIFAQNSYKCGSIRIAENLLNHGACIHSSTLKEGYTSLHFASELFNEEIVKLFLSRGADIHARAKDNSTPIHIATSAGREIMVKLLLEHGAKVDDPDKNGKTILLIATENSNSTMVTNILKHCPDSNNQLNKKSLKINLLFRRGQRYEEIRKALLEYGLIVNQEDANDPELLHAAVEMGYLKIVEDLLKYGANVNAVNESSYPKGFTPLHSAARHKQEGVAELLINYEADVNAQDGTGKTPIFYAIENADSRITKLLLTNRADIRGSSDFLNTAVDKVCIEIVEALLQYGADINATDHCGRTALHFTAPCAVENAFRLCIRRYDIDGDITKLLLSKGANVNAETKDGVTTLHAAAERGYAKVVEALFEYNANVNCKDKSDNTPLHISARKGSKDISIMLLDKGANVNAEQKDGMTPLHLAAQESHEKVVKVLLKRGAKVDSKMKNDMTPLHLAAKKGSSQIVEILLKLGADIDFRDEDGRTALHIASDRGHDDVVWTLLNYGSDINITSKNNHTALDYALNKISLLYGDSDDYDSDNNDSDNNDSDDEFNYDSRFVDFDGYPHKCVAGTLKRHIVKMKTANLYVSEQNLRLISGRHGSRAFQHDCEKEIKEMKWKKFENRKISFYDILTKDTNSLAMYMRIKKIVEASESDDYAEYFPLYANMLENNFKKGIKRRKLLARGNKSFHFLSKGLPKLPYDCTEQIISYLSDKDLRNLIDAGKPLEISNPNTNDD